MKKKAAFYLMGIAGVVLTATTDGFSYGSYGSTVNDACAPDVIYNGDCALCHTSTRSDPTPAKTAFIAGGSTLTDFFCLPSAPLAGDVNGDTTVDLTDAILSLKSITSDTTAFTITTDGDVNSDQKIGLEEAIKILQDSSQ